MTERLVVVADTAYTSLAEIEHLLLDLGQRVVVPPTTYLCTHTVRDERPHYALSVTLDDDAGAEDFGADESAAQHVIAALLALGERPEIVRSEQDVVALSGGLRAAYLEATSRVSGRCVRFPGSQQLVGTVTVAGLLARTAIDRVEVLGGRPAQPDHDVQTRDFVRPLWRDGELVLPVLPAGTDAVAPFEVPNPTPCCGEHAVAQSRTA